MSFFKPINQALMELSKNDYLSSTLWEFFMEDNEKLRFLVKSVSLPFIKFETETRHTGDKVLLKYTPESEFSIEFNETADFKVYDYMKEWQDDIYDKHSRKFKLGKPYVRNGLLLFSKPIKTSLLTSTETYTKTFKFKNMMFAGFEDMSLDYEATNNKTIVCKFTVDSIDEIHRFGNI